jgi:hypothetical protein
MVPPGLWERAVRRGAARTGYVACASGAVRNGRCIDLPTPR